MEVDAGEAVVPDAGDELEDPAKTEDVVAEDEAEGVCVVDKPFGEGAIKLVDVEDSWELLNLLLNPV